jgi:hypothetical protein
MAYGIGSVIGDIDQKVNTYRNNPEALAQMYQQNQQLIDLLALQKLKTEKEAAMRDMQMKMQTPAASIKDQREQEVMGMMRNEVAQQVAPGLQVAGQQAAQAAAPPVPQGGGLPSLPAPNMQGMGMAEGGIVAFAGERGSYVSQEAYRRLKAEERAEKERRANAASAAELEAAQRTAALPYSSESILQDLMSRATRPTSTGRDDVAPVDPGPGSVEPRISAEALRKFDERRAAEAQATSGLGSLLKRAGSSIADAWREGSRIQARPYPGQREQEYIQLMENPEGRLTEAQREAQRQLRLVRDMGLIPAERAQATQAAPQVTQQPTATQVTQQPTAPPTMPTRDEADAIMNVSSNAVKQDEADAIMNVFSDAVKQAPPEVQNEYTRRLSELRGEQESKLDALIAFLQGAGGKTSFAATMSGGAAGMNAREQRIEDEIMATVDKIEGLKLKEREMGVEEDKVSATREGNRLQAEALRYNADRDYDAAMARVDADNYNTLADYQAAMAEKAASSAKAINDAIEKQQLTPAQRLELFASFDENLADDVRAALIEQIKEKGENTPDSPEGQKIIQDGVVAARNDYVLARIGEVAQSYGQDPLFDAADAVLGE